MLKRTLFFENPYYLSIKNRQLHIKNKQDGTVTTAPVEDLGQLVLDHPRITFTQGVIAALGENNVAAVFCDSRHMPKTMLLNLEGHHLQTEMFVAQIKATTPIKKKLWKQTVQAKLRNQIRVLEKLGAPCNTIRACLKEIKSDDSSNREAVAARAYWKEMFTNFKRDPKEGGTNALLNYGYAIIRAAIAQALVGSGLLPTLGIHHRNRYNAYCLADDIMEPFRPFVDFGVHEIVAESQAPPEITKQAKVKLLGLLGTDTLYEKVKRPMMVGMSITTASLGRCFKKEEENVAYPRIP